MKNRLLLWIFLTSSVAFAQNSYYYDAEGKKILANIVDYGLTSFKIHDESKKELVMKISSVSNFVMNGDSVTLLKNFGTHMGHKEFYVQVVVAGKINFYFNPVDRHDGDVQMLYLLCKDSLYQNIDNFNKKWKDLFKDNASIYNRIIKLKPKDYYYNNDKLIALIKEYNAQ